MPALILDAASRQQLDAGFTAEAAELVDVFDGLGKALSAGAAVAVGIGHGDELAAERLVVGNHLEHIRFDFGKGHMGGNGNEARFVEGFFELGYGDAVQTRQLNAVVAQRFQILECAGKILCRVIAGGVDLITDECLFHDACPQFDLF